MGNGEWGMGNGEWEWEWGSGQEIRARSGFLRVFACSAVQRGMARAQSRAHTQSAAMEIMDVTPGAVADAFRAHGVRRMIHGHTHRPAIHAPIDVDGNACRRIVLGDWHRHGSVLRVDTDGACLETIPL